MINDAESKTHIEEHSESIKNPQRIYWLFKKLNSLKKAIFGSSYIERLSDFGLVRTPDHRLFSRTQEDLIEDSWEHEDE